MPPLAFFGGGGQRKSRLFPGGVIKPTLFNLLILLNTLLTHISIRPGAALEQLAFEQVHHVPVPQLLAALGSSYIYMSSLAGAIRRWETAIKSLSSSSTGFHMLVWNSDDGIVSVAIGRQT